MCDLKRNSKMKEFTGYKVAMKKGKKYYSPAMGCEYKVGKVEKVTKQKCLGFGFADYILKAPYLFNKEMVGRTTVFKSKRLANDFFEQCMANSAWQKGLVVLRMTIKDKLMTGYYNFKTRKVVAGKEIVSMKEV